jgi:hypothetical protein
VEVMMEIPVKLLILIGGLYFIMAAVFLLCFIESKAGEKKSGGDR